MASIVAAWPTVALGEVVRPVERPEIPVIGKLYRQVGVKLWGQGAYERESIDGGMTQYKTLSRVEANDIIVNKIWARNGSVSIVTPELAGCYVSGEFPTFAPLADRLLPQWFGWLTKTRPFWEQCDEKSRGTSGKNRIRPEKFLEIEIPLPPLDEQRRIVARIEALAARIEQARGLRREALAEAEQFFINILAQTRRRLLQTQYPICQIGDVTTVTSGGTPSRDVSAYWGGDIPWVKTGELLDEDICDAEECITQSGIDNSSAKIFPVDTILIALYGQGQTRGRTGRLCIPAATNQACCAILPVHSFLEPRFVQYWLRSLYSEMREDTRGGAQPNWNGRMVKNITIALIPLEKQRNIVQFLDKIRGKVDTIKQLQAGAEMDLDALLPSILDKAFRGEL